LRKKEDVALGPQYAGSRVSREALLHDDSDDGFEDAEEQSGSEEEDEDIVDPDTVDMDVDDEDGEIDSDDALGESDDEKFKDFVFRGSGKPREPVKNGSKKRATAADFMSGSEEDENEDEEEDEEEDGDEDEEMLSGESEEEDDQSEMEELEEMDDDEESEESEDDDDNDEDDDKDDEATRRAELRKMMSEEQKSVVATISQAAKADAEKGTAVKQQRKTFDSLLNVRIRLQKALVATNSIAASEDAVDGAEPYQAAEEAAIKLWNTLDGLRHELAKAGSAKTGQKRKRAIDVDTASSQIWERMQSLEEPSIDLRQTTLEKWSSKVRGTTAMPVASKLNNAAQQTITDVLQDQLSNSERLVKRTKMPRSCAPIQAKSKVTEDPKIFDDADFYQLLLKELVDQRMVDSAAAPASGESGRPLQWTAVKEAKTKKNVDTKASKGRKMRFTVHEKLQNFMAPEDRCSWEQDAVDRFFGTLLGQRMNLGEEDAVSDEEEDAPLEEEGLMLFRS
jgi:protein AATF/BFR2